MIRRILAIGDVHGESETLARTLDRFAREVDAVVCVGDLCDGPAGVDGARSVLRILRERSVPTVAGNHDRWLLMGASREDPEAVPRDALSDADIMYLVTLPRTLTLDTSAGSAMVAHGLGFDDLAGVRAETMGYEVWTHASWGKLRKGQFALHIGGHTHRPLARFMPDFESSWTGCGIVNAGTLHRDHRPSACVVDCDARTASWHNYNAATGGFARSRMASWRQF